MPNEPEKQETVDMPTFTNPVDALHFCMGQISEKYGYDGVDDERLAECEAYMNEPVEIPPLPTDH